MPWITFFCRTIHLVYPCIPFASMSYGDELLTKPWYHFVRQKYQGLMRLLLLHLSATLGSSMPP